MFEPGMKYFKVRLTRDGKEVQKFFLPAFDVDDAVSRAKEMAAEAKEKGVVDENPFDDSKGVEAWVQPQG